jgi:hypothetical protein
MFDFRKFIAKFIEAEVPVQEPPGQFYKVQEAPNYSILVEITGDAPYSSCLISVSAVTKGDKPLPLASRFAWKRVNANAEVEQLPNLSNSYRLSLVDCGCLIRVSVQPVEEESIYSEESTVEFGPVTIDPTVKKTLQSILRMGGFKFQLDKMDSEAAKDCPVQSGFLMIFQNQLQISTQKTNQILRLSLHEKIELVPHPVNQKLIEFKFKEDKSKEIAKLLGCSHSPQLVSLRFSVSPNSMRDLLLFSVNMFKNISTVKESEMVNDIVKVVSQDAYSSTNAIAGNEPVGLDKLFAIQALKSEAYLVYKKNKQTAEEIDELQKKARSLDGELTRSINNSAFAPNDTSVKKGKEFEEATFDPTKLGELREQNRQMEAAISSLAGENEELQQEILKLGRLMKEIRFKEINQSKLNASVMKNQSIQMLERDLASYMEENRQLMKAMRDKQEGLEPVSEHEEEHSLSHINQQSDELAELIKKNNILESELDSYRIKLDILEEDKRGRGNLSVNESFLRPQISEKGKRQIEAYKKQAEQLEIEIQKYNSENERLAAEILSQRKRLEQKQANQQTTKIIKKLQHEWEELKGLKDKKQQEILELEMLKLRGNKDGEELAGLKEKLEKEEFKFEQLAHANKKFKAELEGLKETLRMEDGSGDGLNKNQESDEDLNRKRSLIKELERRIKETEMHSADGLVQVGDVKAFEAEKQMHERLVKEIIRLNERLKKMQGDKQLMSLNMSTVK